jgi:hypothetical protein
MIPQCQCDLPDTGHAAAHSAGHPSPQAQEKAPPETGAVFSDERPKDDEGKTNVTSKTRNPPP